MAAECLICGEKLEYLDKYEQMECSICHKKENGKTRCVNNHFVCNDCHMSGVASIMNICLSSKSGNPFDILNTLMSQPFCHMHGPEHHILVGAALLTAYKNSGGDIDLNNALNEMMERGKKVPGGSCGFWGACGAAISSGIFVSILTGSTPLKQKEFALANKMTSKSLDKIGDVGGPRCCKRDSYLSIKEAIDFVKNNFSVNMEGGDILCDFSGKNNQCIRKRCPFFRTF